jgi:magnesium-transporting ATPase (P-type)
MLDLEFYGYFSLIVPSVIITRSVALLIHKKLRKLDTGSVKGYKRDWTGVFLECLFYLYVAGLYFVLTITVLSQYFDINLLSESPASSEEFLVPWLFLAIALGIRLFILGLFPMLYYWPVPLEQADYINFEDDGDIKKAQKLENGQKICEYQMKRSILEDGKFKEYLFWTGETGPTLAELRATSEFGLSNEEAEKRLHRVGLNEIAYKEQPFFKMLLDEYLNYFSAFQTLFLWVATYWNYIEYSTVMVFLIFCLNVYSVFGQLKKRKELKRLCQLSGRVTVMRDKKWKSIDTGFLVPGDLVKLDSGTALTYDGILVARNTVADESLLTGESIPVQKQAFQVNQTSIAESTCVCRIRNSHNYVFSGTHVSHTGSSRLAVVAFTGGSTRRGEILNALLYNSDGHQHSILKGHRGIGLLVISALLNWILIFVNQGIASWTSWVVAFYSVILLVNPFLSLAMLGGLLVGMHRLKQAKILCRNTRALEVCGGIDTLIFDKTGTITETSLSFSKSLLCVVKSESKKSMKRNSKVAFAAMATSLDLTATTEEFPTDEFMPEELLDLGLATCHSAVRVKGKLVGHPLELEMIREVSKRSWDTSNLSAVMSSDGETLWYVNCVFAFSHATKTMSVVVSNDDDDVFVFCKGSFEAVRARCFENHNLVKVAEAVHKYSTKGYYVIAIAVKRYSSLELQREAAESDLHFLGLYLFRNKLKDDSREAVYYLQKIKGVNTTLLTSDSCHTTVSVARDAGLLKNVFIATHDEDGEVKWADFDGDEKAELTESCDLVASIEVFRVLQEKDPKRCEKLKVIGNLLPRDKINVLQWLQSRGKKILLSGDSGNDAAALMTADAGISLNGHSDSLVAAPFSSTSDSLFTLVNLIMESRGTLHASSASVRFITTAGILNALAISVGNISGSFSVLIDMILIPTIAATTWFAHPKTWVSLPRASSIIEIEPILWSISVFLIAFFCLFIHMHFSSWFVTGSTAVISSSHNYWDIEGNTYESQLIVFCLSWAILDAGVVNGALLWWQNKYTVIVTATGFCFLTALLFSDSTKFTCQYQFDCDSTSYATITSTTGINSFLFDFHQSGGSWNLDTTFLASTKFPTDFKIEMFFVLLAASVIHRFGYFYALKNVFSQKLIKE